MSLDARKAALLQELKGRGITDLEALVSKIVESNQGHSPPVEPRRWYCDKNHYCAYIPQK